MVRLVNMLVISSMTVFLCFGCTKTDDNSKQSNNSGNNKQAANNVEQQVLFIVDSYKTTGNQYSCSQECNKYPGDINMYLSEGWLITSSHTKDKPAYNGCVCFGTEYVIQRTGGAKSNVQSKPVDASQGIVAATNNVPKDGFSNNTNGDSLCSTYEKRLFSCKLEKSIKSVSICQSKIDPAMVFYKFGTLQKIENTLPNGKSGNPFIQHVQFGSESMQWVESINFPLGKIVYKLENYQGGIVQLTIDGLNKPFNMTCASENSGQEFADAYNEMERLNFQKR